MMILSNYIVFQFVCCLVYGELLSNEEGDLNIAVVFSDCDTEDRNSDYRQKKINSATWIIDRLNNLKFFEKLKLGLEIHSACISEDYYKLFFDIWSRRGKYFVGIISDDHLSASSVDFANILKLKLQSTVFDSTPFINSSVQLLHILKWTNNVTIFVPQIEMEDKMFAASVLENICIKKSLRYNLHEENITYNFNEDSGPHVLFGKSNDIKNIFMNNDIHQNAQLVVVPVDGSEVEGLADKSYLILPSHAPLNITAEMFNATPTPLIFELAQPILNFVEFWRTFIQLNCNETNNDTVECLKSKEIQYYGYTRPYTNEMIMKILKIEQLRNNFVFDIFKGENQSEELFDTDYKQPLTKMFSYNIFDNTITNLYNQKPISSTSICAANFMECKILCPNFRIQFAGSSDDSFEFRSEIWVVVFLAISVIGLLLSLITLSFLFVCICRKDILEGNPITTVCLSLTILLMYTSVLPFSIRQNYNNENVLCMIRALWTTFSVCGAFSLILARCIYLSTVTKEITYMSHIPGSAQTFLTLFILGVQAALNLSVIKNCKNIFRGNSFLYLMSYNIILLLMILCLCPMIYKSQRNYKEGRFFSISAILITLCWCFWISCYKVLDESWKDMIICFAMVSTASILQGVIFTSRTYLMLVSSASTKIRNHLQNSCERSGVLDVYRADARQVYDCVNVAAINAISAARDGIASTDVDEDIYNYPTLPRGEELNFEIQTNSSSQTDKVTRF